MASPAVPFARFLLDLLADTFRSGGEKCLLSLAGSAGCRELIRVFRAAALARGMHEVHAE